MTKKFYADGTVDDQRIDLESWPLADSPWTHQDIGGNLVVSDGTTSCIYDFERMTIQSKVS